MGQDLPVTSFALLGLLTFGDELTGYELKQRADVTMRFYWVSPAMSQIYTELGRLAERGLLVALDDEGTSRYRITEAGRAAVREWMDRTPAGIPVLKHPVALRLMMGQVTDAETTRAMLEAYVVELAAARRDLAAVRAGLVGRDEPGQNFYHPALVAEWGLAYFDSEAAITHRTLRRMAADGTLGEPTEGAGD